MIIPLDEVAGKISRRLSDNLQSHIMPTAHQLQFMRRMANLPRHPRALRSIVHIFFRFMKGMEVQDARVAVVLA